jgi:hypothetical protein
VLTFGSLTLLFSSYEDYQKFYFLPFRFFELATGGLAAIYFRGRLISHRMSFVFILALIVFLLFPMRPASPELMLVAVVGLTLGVLMSDNSRVKIASSILEYPIVVAIGKISFSLYMWHQVTLAFTRYFWVQELQAKHFVFLILLTAVLSVLSYKFIEQPFRDRKKIGTGSFLLSVFFAFLATNAAAFYVYQMGGVLKDVPELGISASRAAGHNHAAYNDRIHDYNRKFVSESKQKVLVIGASFARDWANVLLELRFSEKLEVSYLPDPSGSSAFAERKKEAKIIFWETPGKDRIRKLVVDESKIWGVGIKNFGVSNGIYYNYSGDDYYGQRTLMHKGTLQKNDVLKSRWQDRYIDYIAKIIDENAKVPVFTPAGRFISHDGRHLTKAGAQYFAQLFDAELANIISGARSR